MDIRTIALSAKSKILDNGENLDAHISSHEQRFDCVVISILCRHINK
nr:MAG TPA_asm: hypothetical protein [Caudoviricetes sp.]